MRKPTFDVLGPDRAVPQTVQSMTKALLSAGWKRRTPRPKEPWYWVDPMGLILEGLRLKEAFGILELRKANGVGVPMIDVQKVRFE